MKGEDNMVEINSRELKKDMMRIEILCDELLELETTKRVKIISKNLEKIKEIVHKIEQKI
jgi:ABC-type phosphate transport system auxiliary subunit